MNNLLSLYKSIKETFSANNISNFDKEARILLKHVLNVSDSDFITDKNLGNIKDKKALIDSHVKKRLLSMPLSKILGVNEFWGMEFYVTEDTLDPRPDTEILIDKVLEWVSDNKDKKYRILDIGTGTACIIISLLKELPNAEGLAIDISSKALKIANKNVLRHKLADRLTLKASDYFSNVDGCFDIIVSNPPYIKTEIITNLEKEVQNHDPILALDGGKDGMVGYKIIMKDIKKHLNPTGVAFFEIGYDQENDIMRLVKDSEVNRKHVHLDYAGNPRVVEISYGDK